jgi:hypothetical protein
MATTKNIYFKEVIGAYNGCNRKNQEFLEIKVVNQITYATTPGFGPGYVNLSAVIVRYYSAKIIRSLTSDEEKQLEAFLSGKERFEDRLAMTQDIKQVKKIAREYIKREQDAWKCA